MCEERGVAMQTIKGIALAPWAGGRRPDDVVRAADRPGTSSSRCTGCSGRDGVFLNTVGDVHLLPHVLAAAETFEDRPDAAAMDALIERRSLAPLFT